MSTDRSILPEKLVQDHLYCTKRYGTRDKHVLSISDPLFIVPTAPNSFLVLLCLTIWLWKYPVNIVNQRKMIPIPI